MKCSGITRLARHAAAVLVLVLCAREVSAQATSGAFRGLVTDPTGAGVPGAIVVARNQTTGITQEVTTTDTGSYILAHLVPGTYSLTVTKDGFKSLSRTDLHLDLDQQVNLDLPLTLGQVSESITVTSAAPVLQTHSVDTGQVIGTREILDLPLDGRDFRSLIFLTAGVTTGVGGNSDNISVNGQREFANSVVVNGIEVTGNRNNDSAITPSVDAMNEFKVVTSAYAAEFGRAAGGVVLLQTKSGANELHGSAYGFYRPSATAAQSYFSTTASQLNNRNFGGTVGGPIRKDKAFFFVSYEGFRFADGDSFLSSVPPTNQVKFLSDGSADLSGMVDPNTGNQIPIFDPLFYAQNFYSQQFEGNIIPADRVSPAGKATLQSFFPVPSRAGTSNGWFNNSLYNYSDKQSFDKVDTRVDYNFSAKDRLAGEYHYARSGNLTGDPYVGQIPVAGGGGTDSGDNTHSTNQSFSVAETHMFSPRMVNELRFGFNNFALQQYSLLNGQDTANQFGVGNVNLADYPQTSGFPYIYLGTGYVTGGSSYKPLTFLDRNYQLVDTISVTRNRHQFKFGGEYRNLSSRPEFSLFPTGYQYYAGAYSYANFTSDPTYSFYDTSAAFPTGGSDIADLLLGLPYTVNIGLQLTNPETKSWELHGFFQDEWQVSSHFSLFYGVRYEYQNPYYEVNGNSSNFDPATGNILIAGRGGNSQALVNADKNNFGPRVGFAYSLNNSKTVIRGGYGVYYSPENDARSDVLTKNYPFSNQQLFFNDINAYYSSGFPTYTLDAGAPRDTTIHLPANGSGSIDPTTIENSKNQSVYYVNPNIRTGYSQLYNITVQHELFPNTSVEVSYVGSQGRKLSYAVGNINLNPVIDPALGHIQALYSVGNSNYNSLQAKIEKHYSNYMSFLFAYTYGKSMDNGPAPFNLGRNHDSPQNPNDLALEYATSSNDINHNFVGSFIYNLPFGHGRKFASSAQGVTQQIVGGWQIALIPSVHTGLPYNIVRNGNDVNLPGLRPNILFDPKQNAPGTIGPNGQYINPNAFCNYNANNPSACPAFGPGNVGDLGRNAFRGPGYFNIDASLLKDVSLTERFKLQLRFEFFNATNTPQFSNPNADFSQKATFGKVTGTVGSARAIQFGAKLIF